MLRSPITSATLIPFAALTVWLSLGNAGCEDGSVDVVTTSTGTPAGGAGGETPTTGGGGSGPACDLGVTNACGAGQKCSVIDPLQGTVGCIAAGSHAAFSTCAVDTDCEESTFCDSATGVCKPLCSDTQSCAGDGRCVAARVSLGEPIPGLELCTAGCHPLTSAPCNDDNGATACVAHNPGDDFTSLDCVAAGVGGENAPCSVQTAASSRSDCAAGLICVTVGPDDLCKRWCSSPGTQAECASGQTCAEAGVSHMGTSFGICP